MTNGESAVIIGNGENMGAELKCVGSLDNSDGTFESANRVYDINGIAQSLTTCGGGNQEPKILDSGLKIKNATKQGYLVAEPGDGIDIGGRMKYHRGNVQKGMIETIKCSPDVGVVCADYRIRKLTPKECFRLMGVKDEDYDKLTVSNTQRYKQAGNSIVVDVLMAIFENMFIKDCKSNRLF